MTHRWNFYTLTCGIPLNSGNYAPFRKKSKLYNNKVYKIVSSGRDDFGCFTKDIIAYLQLKYLIKPSEIASSVLFSSIYYRKICLPYLELRKKESVHT